MSTRDAWKSLQRACALAFAFCASPAHADTLAKDTPQPIREFDIPTVEKLGQEMYDQDQLAWKATDIAIAHFTEEGLKAQKAHGWIVEPSANGNVVRFIRDTPDGPQPFYDVSFAPDGTASSSIPQNTTLRADERAQYDARTLAIASIPRMCSDRYNTVVLKDPQSDGWLVWAMAATTDPKAVIVGGHYRFTISADGKTVRQTDALSKGCLTVPRGDAHEGTPMGVLTEQLVSLVPLETTVFASISYKTPIYIGTRDGKVWMFDGDVISNVDADSAGSGGFAARSLAGMAENCRIIATKPDETPAKYYVRGTTGVINPTEKTEKFTVDMEPGYKPSSIMCGRLDFALMPNDYKVLLAGYTLFITDIGEGHLKRMGVLELVKGQFQFRTMDGAKPTDEQLQKINTRLNAFQDTVQKKS